MSEMVVYSPIGCIRLVNWIVRQPGQKLPKFKLKVADRLGADQLDLA